LVEYPLRAYVGIEGHMPGPYGGGSMLRPGDSVTQVTVQEHIPRGSSTY